MLKNILSIVLITLISGCASQAAIDNYNKKQSYRAAPQLSTIKPIAKPIAVVNPRYPREAALNKTQGWVHLEFYIDEQGKPTDIKAANYSPGKVFVESAISALKQWQFKADDSNAKKKHNYLMEFEVN